MTAATYQAMASRLAALLVLFALVFMCSWLPGKVIGLLHRGLESALDQQRLQRVLTGMNCFAGGVFLATCLLDLLPEIREMVAGPSGAAAASLGDDGFSKDDPGVFTDLPPRCSQTNATATDGDSAGSCSTSDSETDVSPRTYGYRRKRLMLPRLSPSRDVIVAATGGDLDGGSDVQDTPLNRLRRHSSLRQSTTTTTMRTSYDFEFEKARGARDAAESRRIRRTPLDTGVILLLLVLSVHCLFDGLRVGVEPSPSPRALEVIVAVAIHKCVFAFSLGVQYAQTGRLSATGLNRSVLCYSAASPVALLTAFLFELVAANLANLQAVLGSVVPAIATSSIAFKIFLDISPATCQT